MMDDGVIVSFVSPAHLILVQWCSLQKKNGTVHFCVDYRRLNKVTVKDAFPMPRVDDLLRLGRGAKFFNTLDCMSGYWQIPLDEEAIPKSAFVTTVGLCEFLVMPFGLTNAGATFQRYASSVLKDLNFAGVYIDDVIVASESFEEHLIHLRQVLERLLRSRLRLKLSKCSFAAHRTTYLAWKNGLIFPSAGRVEKLLAWQPPKDLSQLRTFRGVGITAAVSSPITPPERIASTD